MDSRRVVVILVNIDSFESLAELTVTLFQCRSELDRFNSGTE